MTDRAGGTKRSGFAWLGPLALAAAALVALVRAVPVEAQKRAVPSASAVPLQALECPTPPSAAAGRDFRGRTLAFVNFSHADLTNANFAGATLKGVVFIRANLTGANFTNAKFVDTASPVRTGDFSFARLDRACFIGATFGAPTYFTHATLACADFSQTDLGNGNAIFGDAPLAIGTAQDCRPRFRQTTMNCEFVGQWSRLDLSHARIGACAGRLQTVAGQPGHDFSGGIYTGVAFDGLDLTASAWRGAVLKHASFQNATLDRATGLAKGVLWAAEFNNASVRNVDLSQAELYGARFTNADLSGSSLAGAFLTERPDADDPIRTAATFEGAHLRNVTLAGARLNGATFQFASFYGTFGFAAPSFPCQTRSDPGTPPAGFTRACATASGADLTGANFTGAYLFGVDFSGTATTVNGTLFTGAVLTGASFASVRFQRDGGAAPDFTKALLQGAVFDSAANLANASFLNAFVDFGTAGSQGQGNNLYLRLSADYTRWRGWSGATSTPCVSAPYNAAKAVPAFASMTCPNGSATVCGAGKTPASLLNWKSGIAMAGNAPLPGWYQFDATYDKAPGDPTLICGNTPVDPTW